MSHGRGELDHVELVEDGGDGPAAHVAGDHAIRSVAQWARRHRTSRLVGVVIVALAAGGTQWGRAAAVHARLSSTPGVVRSLAAPWHTAWQADGALLGVSAPSGTVLVTGNEGHVAALDPTSGQVLWTTGVEPWASGPEGSPQCLLTSPEASSGGLTAAGGQSEYVVCTRAGGAVCTGLSAPGGTATPGSSGVSTGSCVEIDAIAQVLDVRTGQVLRTIDLAWSSPAAATVDGDLVVAGLDADGRLGAARWRLSGTDPVWRYLGARMGAGGTPAVVARGSFLAVFVGTERVNLDASTGAELPPGATVDQGRVTLPSGITAVQENNGTDPEGLRVRILRPDGSPVRTEPGVLQGPNVNDGSVPGLILAMDVQTGRERAINASTGSELWSTAGYSFGPLVDDRLIAWTAGGSLRVLDATTGQVLWQRQIGALPAGPFTPVTDGYRVLALEDAGTRLVARSLATGDEAWSMPWAAADRAVLTGTPSGTALVTSADRVTALAP